MMISLRVKGIAFENCCSLLSTSLCTALLPTLFFVCLRSSPSSRPSLSPIQIQLPLNMPQRWQQVPHDCRLLPWQSLSSIMDSIKIHGVLVFFIHLPWPRIGCPARVYYPSHHPHQISHINQIAHPSIFDAFPIFLIGPNTRCKPANHCCTVCKHLQFPISRSIDHKMFLLGQWVGGQARVYHPSPTSACCSPQGPLSKGLVLDRFVRHLSYASFGI